MMWAFEVEGEIVIAQVPKAALKPAELPPDLQQAIESRFASLREDAIHQLDLLLRGKHKGRALAAYEALRKLIDDDSRRVARAAGQCLASYAEQERQERETAEAAERERQAREQAEQERLRREEAEQERLKAEAERAAQEKAGLRFQKAAAKDTKSGRDLRPSNARGEEEKACRRSRWPSLGPSPNSRAFTLQLDRPHQFGVQAPASASASPLPRPLPRPCPPLSPRPRCCHADPRKRGRSICSTFSLLKTHRQVRSPPARGIRYDNPWHPTKEFVVRYWPGLAPL